MLPVRTTLLALTILGLVVEPGCGASGSYGTSPAIDGGLPADAPASVDVGTVVTPAVCLTGAHCVDNSDCTSGSRCNLALDPPACEMLYCGTPGTACSDDVFCARNSRCVGPRGTCAACTMCSGECILDLSADRRNCGACGHACVGSQQCRSGACVLACDARESACGDRCVDLQQDSQNCGVCGLICGSGEGGTSTFTCERGACSHFEGDQRVALRTTCDSYCTPLGLHCDAANNTAVYGFRDPYTRMLIPCGSTPPQTTGSNGTGMVLAYTVCQCLPAGR
ncbi:MAG: Tryptophan synthase alpha chain [Myxococcaceae bacterium]|nr:Tryptophan synthase alpha chain [Myxococcaceae bacterium]